LDKNVTEMDEFVRISGQPRYRTRQLLEWIYQKCARSFDEMTNMPANWRAELQAAVHLSPFKSVSIQHAADGTKKYLFALHDDKLIESVCIPMKEHFTLCISTQVGCTLRCAFCLTGKQGFSRNLSSGEILGQVLTVRRDLLTEKRISNIVFMGMGEPFLNYAQTVKAIRMLLAEEGFNFSNRKITVSTAGIIPGIVNLGQENLTVNLALSLNAPTDELRSQLMPINKTYPLYELLQTCRAYPLRERRRITFEYVLLNDINDAPEHAATIAHILRGIPSKINLIPFNASFGTIYAPPSEEKILAFQNILLQHNYTTFIRASKGADISAACGQLSGQFLAAVPTK
jgi:23S rRNA (adenine2503-C2)-methyltransferase